MQFFRRDIMFITYRYSLHRKITSYKRFKLFKMLSVEERNKNIRKRMLDITEVKFHPLPKESLWIQPKRISFVQDGKKQEQELVISADSVSIVVFNTSRKKFILVKQFRPASYSLHLPNNIENVDLKMYPPSLGVTIELCAGTVDKNKSITEIAQDELREECGYEAPLSAFQIIQTYKFTKTSTKQTLFYVEVTDEMNTQSGGGLEEEGELIEVIEMSVDEVKKYIESEEIISPPCFLNGIYWFLLNKQHFCN